MYDPVRDNTERQRDMQRDVSPLPAPIPRRTSTLQRRSLEADTMFALDDEGSEDEDEDGEGKRLTGGKLG